MQIIIREIIKRDSKGSEYKELETMEFENFPIIEDIITIKNKRYAIESVTFDDEKNIRYADVKQARSHQKRELTEAQKEARKVYDSEGKLVS